jgi:hypothetical protein
MELSCYIHSLVTVEIGRCHGIMLSFDKQLEKYKLDKAAKVKEEEEKEEKKEKPAWDHKIDVKTPSKKVIKIKL